MSGIVGVNLSSSKESEFMKMSFALVYVLLLGLGSQNAQAQYLFPIQDPYLATLASAAYQPTAQNPAVEVSLVIKKERSKVKIIGDRNKYTFNLLKQKGEASLLFLMPGLGGTPNGGMVSALAEVMYKQGFHVVVLTNPFTWQFSLSGSDTGLSGYVPRDARDLYQVMQQIQTHLNNKLKLKVTDYRLAGYSLGALNTAFIAKLDSEQKIFNFKKVLLINPPMSLFDNLQTLDQFFMIGAGWSERMQGYVISRLIDVAPQLSAMMAQGASITELMRVLKLNMNQIKWVIGAQFRQSLADVIFTSQQIHDLGYLKIPATEGRRTMRLKESMRFGYVDYLKDFVAPEVLINSPELHDVEGVLYSSDLKSLSSFLQTQDHIYLMHNENDFLFNKERDLSFLEEAFANRYTLYPVGGHLGNILFPQNVQDIIKVLKY